jgi:hypothetical protein
VSIRAADVEPLLYAAYQEEADLYGRALAAVTDVPAALQRGENTEARLQQMLELLQQIGTVESRIAPIKGRCQGSGWKPGPQLDQALAQVRRLIERLMACIQEAERCARQRKHQLEPELDALIRGSQMQRAYGNWR